MEFNTQITNSKIETTPTFIQNVAKETKTDVLTQRNAENKSPVMLLQNTSKTPNFKVDVGKVIKTEILDFEIETTPTSIQYVSKATHKFSPEKHNVNDADETDILTHGSEIKEEEEIKTEITDFDIETTPTTIQYVYTSPDSGPACSMCDVAFATEQGFIFHSRITHDELTEETMISEEKEEPTSNAVELKEIDLEAPPQEQEKHNLAKKSQAKKSSTELLYKCAICDKKCRRLGDLKRHERLHTRGKPYECNICAKRFAQVFNLKMHERLHTGDKPYECNLCPKRFTESSKLKRHERWHTGDKPHECKICAKRFTESSKLKGHEKLHTGDKPYECNLCPKRFTESSTLKRHKRWHTGDKPHECNLCPKRFTQSSNLESHERLHTRDKPYECKICLKRFTQSSNLKRHERLHTG